jgi:hypothetical protein
LILLLLSDSVANTRHIMQLAEANARTHAHTASFMKYQF